ncbi:hypothetical protein G6O67_007930 [Ophiocordyceps sinensis]|uniref:Uncharacterized protein n=1 Tax=Ophiocordyceps sinensis TaxID=72228 RepID=A0A8H4LRV4_9HYPO|nr:hypothetical protein G6O67_007930 [Ophiocordyceps sinensis]
MQRRLARLFHLGEQLLGLKGADDEELALRDLALAVAQDPLHRPLVRVGAELVSLQADGPPEVPGSQEVGRGKLFEVDVLGRAGAREGLKGGRDGLVQQGGIAIHGKGAHKRMQPVSLGLGLGWPLQLALFLHFRRQLALLLLIERRAQVVLAVELAAPSSNLQQPDGHGRVQRKTRMVANGVRGQARPVSLLERLCLGFEEPLGLHQGHLDARGPGTEMPDGALALKPLALHRPQGEASTNVGVRLRDGPHEDVRDVNVAAGWLARLGTDLAPDLFRDAKDDRLSLSESPHPHASCTCQPLLARRPGLVGVPYLERACPWSHWPRG